VLGAKLFFGARLAYWPIYLAGIVGLRSAVFAVGATGLALIAVRVFAM
jgi:uncharacterized MAPEG superfamily protein